jgi:trk system potassium uptake protein TrkH
MGVLVFLLAIVPVSEKNDGFTMHLLRAESPGPDVGKLMPKMRKTATALYLTYVALTAFNLIFLLAGDMPFFDALCTAFGTAGTGGFGIKNDSMAGYSPYIQMVTAVFMLLFGINFSCYYLILLRRLRYVFRDEELRLYLGIVFGSILLIFLNVRGLFAGGWEALRHAVFQVSSIITTTGFATTDFDLWPSFSKGILLLLMLVGASAGSTGGGLKCARLLILIKGTRRNISQTLHPQKVQVIRVNDKVMDEKILANTNSYFAAYMLIIAVSFLVVSLDKHSLITNLSAVIACFNNIGPGFDAVGPTVNFSFYSPLSKTVLILDMLLGRLEIFPILVLFSRHTWKRYG